MSMTHNYIPRINQREENLFLEEYYSGTDVKVVLNGNEQSEISYINYSLNEQLKPIYGYASRTFDDVSVGNRIVTGTFKMPIRNTEEQSSYEEVVEAAITTLENIENNNKKEEENKKNTEWITNSSSAANSGATSDIVFEYQVKLINLGYNSSKSGTYDSQTRDAIRKFQLDNNLSGNGTFNNDTMKCIDVKIQLDTTKKATTNSEAKVYTGLTTASGVVYSLKEGEEFYLIQDLGIFTQIKTTSGVDGYIESSRIVR